MASRRRTPRSLEAGIARVLKQLRGREEIIKPHRGALPLIRGKLWKPTQFDTHLDAPQRPMENDPASTQLAHSTSFSHPLRTQLSFSGSNVGLRDHNVVHTVVPLANQGNRRDQTGSAMKRGCSGHCINRVTPEEGAGTRSSAPQCRENFHHQTSQPPAP